MRSKNSFLFGLLALGVCAAGSIMSTADDTKDVFDAMNRRRAIRRAKMVPLLLESPYPPPSNTMNFFAYGSLQDTRIQANICKRLFPNGTPDQITGYSTEPHNWPMTIPRAKRLEGGVVKGTLYKNMSEEDFENMDWYEGSGYKRYLVGLDSGEIAYMYVAVEPPSKLL